MAEHRGGPAGQRAYLVNLRWGSRPIFDRSRGGEGGLGGVLDYRI